MFGENTKYVVALTALAIMVYATPSIRGAIMAPIDSSTQSATVLSATMATPANHIHCPDGYVCTPIPYVKGCPQGYICIPKPVTATVSVNLSLASSSPLTSTVIGTSSIPLLVFNLSAQGGTATVSSITVGLNVSGSNGSSGSLSNAYLYQGSTLVATSVVTSNPTTGTLAQFNLQNVSLPVNTQVPFLVKVDAAPGSNGMILSASVNPVALSISDTNGNIVVATGGAQGNQITIKPVVVVTAPQFSVVGTPTINKISGPSGVSGNGTTSYTASFAVQVQGGSSGVNLGLSNSNNPAVASNSTFITIYKNGSPMTSLNGVMVAYSAPSGTTQSTSTLSFTVAPNQQTTIPVTVSFFVVNPGANVYSVQLNAISWSQTGQSAQTTSLTGAVTSSI